MSADLIVEEDPHPSRFEDVAPDTLLEFVVELRNRSIDRTDEVQRYPLRLVVRGDEAVGLLEVIVQVVIPSIGGGPACDDTAG